jgi:hypothetical protein
MLTEIQKKQLQNLGIEEELIEVQLTNFKQGFSFASLDRPAILNDGIIKPSENDLDNWSTLYEEYAQNSNVVKFVPASGAASRMFKGLFEYINNSTPSNDVNQLIENINKFPFIDDLKDCLRRENKEIQSIIKENGINEIIKNLLFEKGLNYGNLPKGLLKFHQYQDGARTAAEEHVAEGINYAVGKGALNLHFTISPEHENVFREEFEKIKNKYAQNNLKVTLTYSFQKKSTDTIAVDLYNNPILDDAGRFVFRPGGHGALLENLNDIDADLIFIKNIDNVVPDYLKHHTVRYKKALAGLTVKIKRQVDEIITYLNCNDTYTEERKQEISVFMKQNLGITIPDGLDKSKYVEFVKSRLNKPIRICGMVRNVGEPGGGPFWVYDNNGETGLQIVESSQVDMNDTKQKSIFISATHFNPVDLVCSTKDYAGHKFNLLKFRDMSAGFISEKTSSGKKLKAQELPGLWNGSMAYWITLFVEVPIETFNPVKTFTDWLRKEHQPK